MEPLEIAPLINTDKRRRPRKDLKVKQEARWKRYRLFGLLLTSTGGLILMIRVLLDGKVSFYGTLLRLIALLFTGINFAFDPTLTWDARLSYGGPKLFGIITTFVSLMGVVLNDSDFYKNI
jgi:hypothetical protein